MKHLVEYPLDGGGTIVVETDLAAASGPTVRGWRDSEPAARAGETFEAAIARVRPAAAAAIAQLRELADPPDEITVEFGISLSAEVGAVIARSQGEANFRLSMRWSRTIGSPWRRLDLASGRSGFTSPVHTASST